MNKLISSVALLAIAGNLLMAGGDIAPVEPVLVEEAPGNEWKYTASIYLWGSSIGGEAATGSDVNVDFNDLLENLNMVFMGDISAQKGKWGFVTDIIYIDLENNPDSLIISDVELKAWIVTPVVTYRVMESDQLSLDLLAGARYLYMKPRLEIASLPAVSTSGSVWDGIVGIKGKYDLNEKWFVPFQFDVGAGDTKLTWQAFAGIGYKYENFDVVAGYRYMDWDFDDNDKGGEIFNDFNMGGPIIGARYRF